jgi:tryptophan halogenase
MSQHRITVVGGGTAGVMAATYLKSYWGELVDVTMIYDHSKPGIGVGESLTPIFDKYLSTVGVSTIDLIKHCNATIKLGLRFKNWAGDGREWIHSFPVNEAFDSIDRTVSYYNAVDAYDISVGKYENAFNYDRFYFDNNLIFGADVSTYRHALHIDATVVGRYIESKFKDRINIIDGVVEQVNINQGKIESIRLASGQKIVSDLYIDASGLGQAMFKQLDPEWVSVEDQLPTNRTIPNPLFKDYDYIPPYTTAEATKNGWILDVPLSHRRGTGYVYSSKFTTDEQAKQDFNQWLLKNHGVELGSDRVIKFSNGYWKQQWIGNCIAIGLSSGFVEPLEATSLHNTFVQLEAITGLYSFEHSQHNIDKYNKFSNSIYEDCFEYIRFFYHTKRTDSEFWRYLNENSPDWLLNLEQKMRTSFVSPRDFTNVIFDSSSYISVGYGHGYYTQDGTAKYLQSKYLTDIAKAESHKVQQIKQDVQKYAVDHKQWIDLVKSL